MPKKRTNRVGFQRDLFGCKPPTDPAGVSVVNVKQTCVQSSVLPDGCTGIVYHAAATVVNNSGYDSVRSAMLVLVLSCGRNAVVLLLFVLSTVGMCQRSDGDQTTTRIACILRCTSWFRVRTPF